MKHSAKINDFTTRYHHRETNHHRHRQNNTPFQFPKAIRWDDCFKLSGKIRKEWTDEIIKALSSAQLEEDCDTCKHGHFGDVQCERCRVRYPSHYERRTDE